MIYRQLGSSSFQISRIGFGCMSLKKEQAETERILHGALDLGINFFDTADLYEQGENERMVGKAFKQKRKEVILATKVGNRWRDDGSGWYWDPRKEYILKAVDGSLKRLGTDYIDLYQLHGGTREDPIDETIEAFDQLMAAGKIRYYGISSIRPNVIREWVNRSSLVSVMTQYSLLDRRPEESILPLLHEKGIGVLVRGSVAQGLLVDKPAKSYLDRPSEDVARAAEAMRSLQTHTAGEAAIQFVLNHPAVTAAVVGIRTERQLEEAVRSPDNPLSEKEFAMLQNSVPPNHFKEHR